MHHRKYLVALETFPIVSFNSDWVQPAFKRWVETRVEPLFGLEMVRTEGRSSEFSTLRLEASHGKVKICF
jgi:hypothetical protein